MSQQFTYKYGIRTNVPLRPADVEAYAFRNRLQPEEGGLGTLGHFDALSNILLPKVARNPWMNRGIESLIDYKEVAWAGCGAAGKTFTAAYFAMLWWAANPLESAVIMTSTTSKMVRKRMWSAIQEMYRNSTGFPGRMVDSKMSLQAVKGDDKHCISAIAVEEGSKEKAIGNIQGIHAKRVLVIIDEATHTSEAMFDVCSNLRKGTKEFLLLVIGNPQSKFDLLGKFAEPLDGWASVSVEDDEWLTKTGVCIRFDGMRSPNVKAGRTIWPYLLTKAQLVHAVDSEGEESPNFWKYTRGFWPPDGAVKTVISETLATKHDLTRTIKFAGAVHHLAGLDPAFCGGDRCILRFGRLGKTLGGVMALNCDEIVPITPNARDSEPIHYQIANRVIAECEKRGVIPERFAMDSTGEGGGLADILTKTWGLINRIEFGGRPSEKPVSEEDTRPSDEAYDRKVSELWFSVRRWAMADKIGGLDGDTLREFCGRLYKDDKRKVYIEPKPEMKKRTGKSPDLADAAVALVELARQLGGETAPATKSNTAWERFCAEHDAVYAEENTYQTGTDEYELETA
jgi:hypothetical protein